MGSASMIVWPPATTACASATLSAPPRRICATVSLGRSPGEGGDVQRQDGVGAHGVDVAQSVGGRDRAVIVWVVDERREEIYGENDGLFVADAVDGGVVRGGEADEEFGVMPVLKLRQVTDSTCASISAPALAAQPAQEASSVSRTGASFSKPTAGWVCIPCATPFWRAAVCGRDAGQP